MPFLFLFLTLTPMFAQTCFTPSETPCMTLRIAETSWHNRSFGLHNVDRYRMVAKKAFRRDGAVAYHLRQSHWKNFLIPLAEGHGATLQLPDRTISINHDQKQYHVNLIKHQGVAFTRRGGRAFSSKCDTSALDEFMAVAIGTDSIAGYEVFHFTNRWGDNGVVHFYRAPALGCTTLKEVSWDYNQFGFPTRYREWVVTSIEIGEPDPKLFDVPGGYFGLF
jgi:hypothetical protein